MIEDVSISRGSVGLHTSLSFNSFLLNTQLPAWHPLKNTATQRSKILTMLNLKTDKGGGAVKYDASAAQVDSAVTTTTRQTYRIGIIGAGLGGLGCAQELLRLSKEKGLDLNVVLLEARNRVGGRCFTDTAAFKTPDGRSFPIELGASWVSQYLCSLCASINKRYTI